MALSDIYRRENQVRMRVLPLYDVEKLMAGELLKTGEVVVRQRKYREAARIARSIEERTVTANDGRCVGFRKFPDGRIFAVIVA